MKPTLAEIDAKLNKGSQALIIGMPHPQTWPEYRAATLGTFGGGYHTSDELAIFHHGINTVFNLLDSEIPSPRETRHLCQVIKNLERQIADHYNALAEMGIYPQSFEDRDGKGYSKRTDWMDGWNAALIEFTKKLAASEANDGEVVIKETP